MIFVREQEKRHTSIHLYLYIKARRYLHTSYTPCTYAYQLQPTPIARAAEDENLSAAILLALGVPCFIAYCTQLSPQTHIPIKQTESRMQGSRATEFLVQVAARDRGRVSRDGFGGADGDNGAAFASAARGETAI